MPEAGQKFLQKLADGKIHECEWVKPYFVKMSDGMEIATERWVAKVTDNFGGYEKDEHFFLTPTSF
jgi:hypothetical protein